MTTITINKKVILTGGNYNNVYDFFKDFISNNTDINIEEYFEDFLEAKKLGNLLKNGTIKELTETETEDFFNKIKDK